MIFAMIFILVAMAWLLIETDMLRVNLAIGAEPTDDQVSGNQTGDGDTSNFEPSVFTESDMPETKGNLNIVCKRS